MTAISVAKSAVRNVDDRGIRDRQRLRRKARTREREDEQKTLEESHHGFHAGIIRSFNMRRASAGVSAREP